MVRKMTPRFYVDPQMGGSHGSELTCRQVQKKEERCSAAGEGEREGFRCDAFKMSVFAAATLFKVNVAPARRARTSWRDLC